MQICGTENPISAVMKYSKNLIGLILNLFNFATFFNCKQKIHYMKIILATVLSLTCIAAIAKTGHKKEISKAESTPAKTIYDFKIKSLEGGTIDFSQYKGKKILIVNTASKCGFTPQYAGLEKLYEQYKD